MGFHIAYADASGARITASEYLLPLTPTGVDYPSEALGALLETSDGAVIQQQPNKDSRRRSWYWNLYRDSIPGYPELWDRLQALRSRMLVEGGAPTPYCFIKEDVTKKLRIRDFVAGTATGGSSNTLQSAQTWTVNQFTGYRIHLLAGTGAGQFRTILSNTSNTVTVDSTWATTPDSTTKFELFGFKYDWIRVRVVDVNRTLPEDGRQVRYPETRFVFVIDDPAFNDIG